MHLTDTHRIQYQRQMSLAGFGEHGQLKLKSARVLIVGLGGLGHPVAHYLAAAGVGQLTLVDFDIVEISNLPRQLLFSPADCGKPKAEVAAQKLSAAYPDTRITVHATRADSNTLQEWLAETDLVADCTDNFETRYTIDRLMTGTGIPLVIGAAHQREGLISSLHGTTGVGYSDVYPTPPAAGRIGTCSTEGVSGPMVGVIGSMMAQCIIDLLVLGRSHADGKLIRFDGNDFSTFSAGIPGKYAPTTVVDSITTFDAHQFKACMQASVPPRLIDVRELFEHEAFNLGGICLPAGEVKAWMNQLSTEHSYLLYCNQGSMSYMAAHVILRERPGLNIAHLSGGIDALNLMNERS